MAKKTGNRKEKVADLPEQQDSTDEKERLIAEIMQEMSSFSFKEQKIMQQIIKFLKRK